MHDVINILAWVAAIAVSISLFVILLESIVALLPSFKRKEIPEGPRPNCAILVPACNEEAGLGNTIKVLQPQLLPGDRLIVIADNCTDKTAEVARSFGVEVLERFDAVNRSKMFAVNHGVRFLEQAPSPVVIVVDADCVVPLGGIDRLTREAIRTNRPVQAGYYMQSPPDGGPRDKISAFAFQYKNCVRPLGLLRLGLPCSLTGSGMAFPWPIARDVPLAHSKLADDYSVTVDLALQGHLVRFLPDVEVISELPPPGRAAYFQRKRWEQGHFNFIFTQTPRLIWQAFSRGKPALIALALEFSVLPLSMLFLFWFLVSAGLILNWSLGGNPWPAILLTGLGLLTWFFILANWLKSGRKLLPASTLVMIPFYVLGKVPMYIAMLFKPQRAWVRSERAKT